MITTFMLQFNKSCNRRPKVHLCGKLVQPTAPLDKDFKTDANGTHAFIGDFLCAVETGKLFVNVHLHCNVSNLKMMSKISTFQPLEKFLRTPMATLTLSASFDVWTNKAKLKLAMYEIETFTQMFKMEQIYRLFCSFALLILECSV